MRGRPLTELVIDDVGGAFTVGLAYIGDKLGLFAALAALGSASSEALARKCGLQERYVREWLKAMVASEYLELDAATGAYFLTAEQKAVLVDEASRTFAAGMFQLALPSLLLAPRLVEVFRQGGGISFAELPAEIPDAIDRTHRAWFDHLLVAEWLPGAPGLVDALDRGVSVLDVGCGMGRSTVAVARAFPRSTVLGIDPHEPSIDRARDLAREHGAGNARFTACTVEQLAPGGANAGDGDGAFDLVLAIDCVHDMIDPVRSLRAIAALSAPAGVVLWSEPTGSSDPLENRNPPGRMRASLSPFHCLTVSLASGGAGLGTIIGESGARDLARQAGFASFDRLSIDSKMQQFFLLRARH